MRGDPVTIAAKSLWYVHDPLDGTSFFDTEAKARAAAYAVLDDMREASDQGWPEGVNDLHWGEITTRHETNQANVVETPGGEFDSTCEYEFVEVTS